jgi:hypothetical protein
MSHTLHRLLPPQCGGRPHFKRTQSEQSGGPARTNLFGELTMFRRGALLVDFSAGQPVLPATYEFETDPGDFPGQTYVVARNETGHLNFIVVDGIQPRNSDEALRCLELGSSQDVDAFDAQSVYLLSWRAPSVTATLTGLRNGVVIGSTLLVVHQDPTQVKVDWTAIDALAISCHGCLGFPLMANFLFL